MPGSQSEKYENQPIGGLSFSHRLELLVLVSILIPAFISGVLAFIDFDQQLQTKLTSQLAAEQKILSLRLDHRRDDLLKELKRISTDNTLQMTLVRGVNTPLKNYLKQQMAPRAFSALGVFDRSSQLIAHQGKLPAACVSSAESVFIDHQQGELCMRTPIFKNGTQLGEAVASIAMASEDFLKPLKTDSNSHSFLLVDGRLVWSDLKFQLPLKTIKALPVGVSSTLNLAGMDYILQTGMRDYGGHPVLLGTMLPRDKEYSGYWHAAAEIGVILLLVTLLLVIVMHKFVQGLLRPISNLTIVARQIEQGKPPSLQLNCKRTDELGLLNRTFVKMATTHQRHAKQLEKTVAERTAALTQMNHALKKDIVARKEAEDAKKQLEQQLFQTQKMDAIGTMAGGIAHDMNNTLAPILAYTEMVMRKLPEMDENQRRLKKVRLAANRCRDLVSQILMFSRQGSADKTTLQPHLVMQETAQLLRASTPATIQIINHIDADCGQILGNESQIHQIILNLCTNAVQAMDQEGTLRVSLRRIEQPLATCHLPPPFAQIEVSDTGYGMTEEVRARIFEPFFTTKEVGQGTGMGLSVIHGIVLSHGGEIQCHSRPGKGTRFQVFLPLIAGAQPLVSSSSESNEWQRGSEHILLLDDEPEITASWAEYLREYGYQVICVNTVSEALKQLQKTTLQFNLLISDQTMPQKTGLQLARELYRSYPDLPILLCTGNGADFEDGDLKGTCVQKILSKPLTGSELITAVRKTFLALSPAGDDTSNVS